VSKPIVGPEAKKILEVGREGTNEQCRKDERKPPEWEGGSSMR
jgi:hypothetical protein